MRYEVELRGCAPEPLMAYLKALGIFRLVSEQKDSSARAWWRNDRFYLSSALDRDGLVEFFLYEYRPTPVVSPWNNRYKTGVRKGDSKGLDVILASSDKRFSDYSSAILLTKELIKVEDDKERILKRCRTLLSDNALEWVDAVYVLTAERPKYPPLTSNGGTLGTSSSGDISMNFAKNLVAALGLGSRQRKSSGRSSQEWMVASLYGGTFSALKNPGGQFSPGGWGPNSTNGFEDESLVNPWDFVLMIEGALGFAGAPVRRLSSESQSKAVFPFTVDMAAAGYSTPTATEYGSSARAEFWAPLWDRPTTLGEFRHIATEGRAQLGRRQASNGTDFVRAISGLGVERGISSFQRFGFLQRTGIDGVFAAAIGRFAIRGQPAANLLFDLDRWLNGLRSQAGGSRAPVGLGAALSRIDSAIFDFCQRGSPRDLQSVLIAVGHAERWLSKSVLRKENNRGRGVLPFNMLSQEWLAGANDDSIEFRLARALASILGGRPDGGKEIGPVRENMDPVDAGGRTSWKEDSTSFVWTAGDPLDNMLAVLERRCLEGRMLGLTYPPLSSGFSARLADVVEFLDGNLDTQRVADLALPLSFVRYWRRDPPGRAEGDAVQRYRAPSELPTAYAVMKLTLLAEEFDCQEFGPKAAIWMEPRMLAMLRAGRVREAYGVAHRRLKASGLQPLSDDPGLADGSGSGRRLAAALLFPLDGSTHCALAERAVRKPNRTEL
ncbi:MAG: type I-U CRISPR-associated protein Csx17 [Caldilineaceae bacterium]|nr:type I-U CRISPR-associated protein Csx17 [Caldilineaceae bacterium]